MAVWETLRYAQKHRARHFWLWKYDRQVFESSRLVHSHHALMHPANHWWPHSCRLTYLLGLHLQHRWWCSPLVVQWFVLRWLHRQQSVSWLCLVLQPLSSPPCHHQRWAIRYWRLTVMLTPHLLPEFVTAHRHKNRWLRYLLRKAVLGQAWPW